MGTLDLHGLFLEAIARDPDAVVEFATAFHEYAKLDGSEHVYCDPYVLCQLTSGAQGYVFAHPGELDDSVLEELTGRKVGTLRASLPDWAKALIVDACWGEARLDCTPHATHELLGSGSAKSRARAVLLSTMVPPWSNRLGIIGGIEDVIAECRAPGRVIRLADFHLKGTVLAGVLAEGDFLDVLKWADFLLITGNILKTNTLSSIAELLVEWSKPAHLYAMSGHNLFAVRIRELPFRSVSSERFPFYWYANCQSFIDLFGHEGAAES